MTQYDDSEYDNWVRSTASPSVFVCLCTGSLSLPVASVRTSMVLTHPPEAGLDSSGDTAVGIQQCHWHCGCPDDFKAKPQELSGRSRMS